MNTENNLASGVNDGFKRGIAWQKEQDKAKYQALLDSSVDIIQTLMQYGNIRPIEV